MRVPINPFQQRQGRNATASRLPGRQFVIRDSRGPVDDQRAARRRKDAAGNVPLAGDPRPGHVVRLAVVDPQHTVMEHDGEVFSAGRRRHETRLILALDGQPPPDLEVLGVEGHDLPVLAADQHRIAAKRHGHVAAVVVVQFLFQPSFVAILGVLPQHGQLAPLVNGQFPRVLIHGGFGGPEQPQPRIRPHGDERIATGKRQRESEHLHGLAGLLGIAGQAVQAEAGHDQDPAVGFTQQIERAQRGTHAADGGPVLGTRPHVQGDPPAAQRADGGNQLIAPFVVDRADRPQLGRHAGNKGQGNPPLLLFFAFRPKDFAPRRPSSRPRRTSGPSRSRRSASSWRRSAGRSASCSAPPARCPTCSRRPRSTSTRRAPSRRPRQSRFATADPTSADTV